jgi:23S rRNA (cytosine1962-C5)-methyltransferase
MQTVRLGKGADRRVALGHLWVFSNEIAGFDRTIPPGEDVVVLDAADRIIGTGSFSPASLIAVRLHARGREQALDASLIAERVRAAWQNRQTWFGPEAASCRVVYGDADGLPGLVTDRYGEYCSVQILTAGMERRIPWVLDALEAAFHPRGIVLRNDSRTRELEGLPLEVRLGRGEVPERIGFELHGLRFLADLWHGQKTGFFFDQRENYRFLRPFAPGARVLDAFCYTGAWGLHAALWGADGVRFVDTSQAALELARQNAGANGFRCVDFSEADVVAHLKGLESREVFDVVVLDPPAFAKSRGQTHSGLRGYLNLNKWALRRVRPEGYLVTCSCSHHVSRDAFVGTLARAAREAGREIRVLNVGGQAPDHPWLPSMAETAYLKAVLLQVG